MRDDTITGKNFFATDHNNKQLNVEFVCAASGEVSNETGDPTHVYISSCKSHWEKCLRWRIASYLEGQRPHLGTVSCREKVCFLGAGTRQGQNIVEMYQAK